MSQPDLALEERIDAAALRLLNAMFISGVTAAEAILHREQDTEQWRRAYSYARLVLDPQPTPEPDTFGRTAVTLIEHRDACAETAAGLRAGHSTCDTERQAMFWDGKVKAAQARIDAGEVYV